MRTISCLFWQSRQKFGYETEKILDELRREQTDETTLTRTKPTKSRTLQQVSIELVIHRQGHGSGADSLQHKNLILCLCFKQNSKIIINTVVCHTRSTMKPSSVESSWTKYEPCGSKTRLFGRTSNRFTYLFLFVIAEQGWNHSSYYHVVDWLQESWWRSTHLLAHSLKNHEIIWNANLMQQGYFINVFLARHVSGTYAHHQEH